MWAIVAQEMAILWRAVEAIYWELGEQEMARRAGVIPFDRYGGPIKLRAERNTT